MTIRSGLALCSAVASLLLACGGSGDLTAHPPPPHSDAGGGGVGNPDGGGGGGSLAVTGQVVDGAGQPVVGRIVLLGNLSTTTDVLGQFSFTGVSAPYDLTLVATS